MSEKKVYLMMLMMVAMLLIAAATGCKKGDSCYSHAMYELHKNDFCTADCPGVTGCDGKTYCNECEANKQGIAVQ